MPFFTDATICLAQVFTVHQFPLDEMRRFTPQVDAKPPRLEDLDVECGEALIAWASRFHVHIKHICKEVRVALDFPQHVPGRVRSRGDVNF